MDHKITDLKSGPPTTQIFTEEQAVGRYKEMITIAERIENRFKQAQDQILMMSPPIPAAPVAIAPVSTSALPSTSVVVAAPIIPEEEEFAAIVEVS